jgi:hypothetical protein
MIGKREKFLLPNQGAKKRGKSHFLIREWRLFETLHFLSICFRGGNLGSSEFGERGSYKKKNSRSKSNRKRNLKKLKAKELLLTP